MLQRVPPGTGPAGVPAGRGLGDDVFVWFYYFFAVMAALGIVIRIWDNIQRRQFGWAMVWIGVGFLFGWLVWFFVWGWNR